MWNEIERNIPFVIHIMNAVSGKDTNTDLRVKYSFLYSILMNERWHELSVLKRVNTVLVYRGWMYKAGEDFFIIFAFHRITVFINLW